MKVTLIAIALHDGCIQSSPDGSLQAEGAFRAPDTALVSPAHADARVLSSPGRRVRGGRGGALVGVGLIRGTVAVAQG